MAKAVGGQLRRPSGALGPIFGAILNRANRRLIQTAVDSLECGRNDEVLEIGFGGGEGMAQLLDATDGGLAGVEVSDAMLDKARRRFRSELADGRLELRQASVESMPFPAASFDRVLSTNTIYFWPDPHAGLIEIARVLRPGGRLVLGTAPAESMRKSSFTREGFRFFTDSELEDSLRGAGFRDVSVERKGSHVMSSGAKR